MSRSLLRWCALVFVLLQMSALSEENPTLENLNWLAGKWRLEKQARTANGETLRRIVDEQWTSSAGGMMLGVSRTVENGKTVSFEFLRIVQRSDGTYYIAQPNGDPPTEFRLKSAQSDEWVFENPAHPFPRRIRYRRDGEDALMARIEDESGTKYVDFAYSRVP